MKTDKKTINSEVYLKLSNTIKQISAEIENTRYKKVLETVEECVKLNELSKYLETVSLPNQYQQNLFYKRYIKNYNTIYYDKMLKSLNKIYNNKYQEYIELSSDIYKDYFESISDVFNKIDKKESIIDDISKKMLTTQIEAIPKYVSYAYSEKSDVSIEEAYDKSDIKKISDLGKDIITNMININKLYKYKNEKNIWNDNSSDFAELSLNIRNVADSEDNNKLLITLLFKGIYEYTNDGDNNMLYSLANDNNICAFGLDIIKAYRNVHEHALTKTDKKKINMVYTFNQKYIGKKIPQKPSEYCAIQLALYEEINNFLKEILDLLNE